VVAEEPLVKGIVLIFFKLSLETSKKSCSGAFREKGMDVARL